MPTRTGRFKIAVAGTPQTIISGRSESFYRVYNSSEGTTTLITVTSSKGGPPVELLPATSVDVGVDGDVTVQSASIVAKGIYVALELDTDIRSGRVKFTAGAVNEQRAIIDLTGGRPAPALYRVFNSGEVAFRVGRGRHPHFETVQVLAAGDSVDVEVGTGGNRSISIQAVAVADKIEAIYEFLGTLAD